MVRIIKIKEIFGKADEIIHSKDVYKVMKVNKNTVTLDNGNNYKSYEIIKVKDIIYLDYENNKDEELANQIFQKEQKIKRELKKVNVDEKNIINTKVISFFNKNKIKRIYNYKNNNSLKD